MFHSLSLWLFLVLLLLGVVPFVSSNSAGANLDACSDQDPNNKPGTSHSGGIQSGNGGYTIVIPNDANPQQGNPIQIQITSTTPFLGFLISAFPKTVAQAKSGYNGKRLGTWAGTSTFTSSVQPYNCPGDIVNSALTHTLSDTKISISLIWTPPPSTTQPITLAATIVRSIAEIYQITADFPTGPTGPSAPGVPFDVFPVSATMNSLNITWSIPKNQGSSPITTYVIQLDAGREAEDQSHDEPIQPITTFDTNSALPYFNIQNLTTGWVYRMAIAAKNDVGISVPSTPFLTARVLRNTSTTAPKTPPTVTIPSTFITQTQAMITWTGDKSGETLVSYQVERVTMDDMTTRTMVVIYRIPDIRAAVFTGYNRGQNLFSFNDTTLFPNTSYLYRVITTTLAGSMDSGYIPMTTKPCGCFNRGNCEVTKVQPREAFCNCPDGWLGKFCEMKANYLSLGNGRLSLQWNVSDPLVYVRLTGPRDAWFGLMLNPDPADGMSSGADAWLANFNNGQVDFHSIGRNTPVKDTITHIRDHKQDSNSTNTWITFSRELDTRDTQDAVISPNKGNYMRLSWAIGSSTVLVQHDRNNYGKAQIDWAGGNGFALDRSLKYGMFYLPIIIGLGVCIITGLLLRFRRIYRSPFGRLLLRARVPPPLVAPTIIDKLTLDIRPTIQTLSIGELMIIISYLSCFAGMIGYGYKQFYDNQRDPRYVWGHVTAVHIALTWLPVTKNSVWLYVFGIPFERAIHYHRMVARMTLICIYIHLGTMINIWGSSIVTSTDGTYGGDGVLWGFIAMIIFSCIVALAYEPIRRFSYEWFVYPHFVLTKTATVFAMIHSVYLRWFLLVPLVLWGWDQLVGMFHAIKYTQPIESLIRFPAQGEDTDAPVSILRVKVPPSFRYRAGDYCFLQFPSISIGQWHPFSISSSPSLKQGESQTLTFHMLDMGEGTFTRNVSRLATTWMTAQGDAVHKNIQTTVKIDGPYGRLMIPVYEYPHVILVAGGVGATPIVSILGDLFARYKQGQLPHLKSVDFIWCSRSLLALREWWGPLFNAIQTSNGVFKLHLYCTTAKDAPTVQVHARENILQHVASPSEEAPCCTVNDQDAPKAAPPSPPDVPAPVEMNATSAVAQADGPTFHGMESQQQHTIPILPGRPMMRELFKQIHGTRQVQQKGDAPSTYAGNPWGVLCCGPPQLVTSTRQLAYRYECDWHEETFFI